jgi:hypothetical protein
MRSKAGRALGKGEVVSSILTGSTTKSPENIGSAHPPERPRGRFACERCTNVPDGVVQNACNPSAHIPLAIRGAARRWSRAVSLPRLSCLEQEGA